MIFCNIWSYSTYICLCSSDHLISWTSFFMNVVILVVIYIYPIPNNWKYKITYQMFITCIIMIINFSTFPWICKNKFWCKLELTRRYFFNYFHKMMVAKRLNIWTSLNVKFLWGVAVFELDSHPDHNKGPDLRS